MGSKLWKGIDFLEVVDLLIKADFSFFIENMRDNIFAR